MTAWNEFAPDTCGSVTLAVAATWVASLAVRYRPRVASAGGFVGVVVFVGAVFAGLGPSDAPFPALATAATYAGLAMAACWLALTVLAVVGDGVRAVTRGVRDHLS